MARAPQRPPVVVICGDEPHQKSVALGQVLDALLPPDVDRAMALAEYDGGQSEEQGGPSFAAVMDDLATLPFLADRRVVLVREADRFVSTWREKLENYAGKAIPTATLVLECRTFPKTTRLYKAVEAARGEIRECKKLTGRALTEFVIEEARARRKRLDWPAAARLCELIGQDQERLSSEVEKLSLFTGDRPEITLRDVGELVGQTREEKVFAAMDAAGAGRLDEALVLWNQVLATDRAAAFKAVGGLAFVIRRWLAAQRMATDGVPVRAIAPKVMMWGREQLLEAILRRLRPEAMERALASLADLDAQAKSGIRSIETGVEALLAEVATPAR